MQTIIGLTGAIGSGKTTLADFLGQVEPSHAHYESFLIIAEVADVFNQLLSDAIKNYKPAKVSVEEINNLLDTFVVRLQGVLRAQINASQLEIVPSDTQAHPELYEKLFAYLQTVQANPGLLDQPITATNKAQYRPLLQWLGGYLNAKVSPTLWFDEIFHRIQQHDQDKKLIVITGVRYPSDASVIKKHGGVIVEIKRGQATQDATDVTERERKDIVADATIDNNGSLENLLMKANILYKNLAKA